MSEKLFINILSNALHNVSLSNADNEARALVHCSACHSSFIGYHEASEPYSELEATLDALDSLRWHIRTKHREAL